MPKSTNNWTKLDDRGSIVSKDKQYRNLHTWKGKCALCDVEFITHTPGSSPADKVPTITTCDEHRGAPKAIAAGWATWNGKDVVPGARMKLGVAGGAVSSDDADNVAELRKELAEAYAANAEAGGLRRFANEAFGLSLIGPGINYDSVTAAYAKVYGQIDVLKARLAKYELAPAMEAVKPNGIGFRGATKNKLPWE